MSDQTLFRPELVLELRLGAGRKQSRLEVKSADDAILVLEGIKELTDDHLVLIYLNGDDVVVGVDSFLCGLDEFDAPQASRAVTSLLHRQNRDPALKVVVAQSVPRAGTIGREELDLKGLARLATRIVAFEVELVDCILMGREGYFSYRQDADAWGEYQQWLESMRGTLLEEPFFPRLVK